MTNPGKSDLYVTQLKTKYLKGLVSTATTSVGTATPAAVNFGNYLTCDVAIEVIDNSGNTYYIPAYGKGN